MVPRGLEPRTLRLLAVRSDQLSYETSGHEPGYLAGSTEQNRTVPSAYFRTGRHTGPYTLFLDAHIMCISGLVVEYVVAIDVTRVRFPADAFLSTTFHRKGCECYWNPAAGRIYPIAHCGSKFRCRDSNPGRSGESRVS